MLIIGIRGSKGRFALTARSLSETKRVRYLLGLSSPAERQHIESEYFENEDAFQAMLEAEDDLIDAYARGELDGEERLRFEKSFVSSLPRRDRVQFARAFAPAVSATRSFEAKRQGTLANIVKNLRSPSLSRTAAIALVIVFVAVLALLISDRRRMTDELRKLRAESAELSQRTKELERSSDIERKRTAEIATQLADLRAQPDEPRHRERVITATQRARQLPDIKNDRETIASSKSEQGEEVINTQDASLGNTLKITELPVDGRKFSNLLSLQTGENRGGYVAGGRANQANITLDGLSAGAPLNTYSLMPRNTSSSGDTTIHIAKFFSWIRFHLTLETAAIHEEYSIAIKTADGRAVTSVNWIEPITPKQTIIDSPAISTGDLPSGDYVLLLMGKKPDGLFIKIGKYPFKVIKY